MKLVGKDIYLRFLDESDAAAKLELNLRNREFFEAFLTTRSEDFYTIDYQLNSIKTSMRKMERDEEYIFGVFLASSDDLIGITSLTEVVRGALQSCWLGCSLDKDYNGRGITTEAVRLVVGYAFQVSEVTPDRGRFNAAQPELNTRT